MSSSSRDPAPSTCAPLGAVAPRVTTAAAWHAARMRRERLPEHRLPEDPKEEAS